MAGKRIRPKELFTIDEANATLPLVGRIVTDLVGLSRDVVQRRQRLAAIGQGRHPEQNEFYLQERLQMERELDEDNRRLREYVEELRELGVEPTDTVEGAVDFPAVLDGRKVFLCWKLGEPEILYWHAAEAGFGERQPLAAGSSAEQGIGPGSENDRGF
jgi:hypothetical protein